jgi:class 3 adenylate cyclase
MREFVLRLREPNLRTGGLRERWPQRAVSPPFLAADVAGYSRLMGADEEGTHERLKAHFGQLVEPKIKQQRGRIVKNTGDGLLRNFRVL